MFGDQPINNKVITYSKTGEMSDLILKITKKYDLHKKSINIKKEKNKNYVSLRKFDDR